METSGAWVRSKPPAGLIGMLVLVLLAEWGAARRESDRFLDIQTWQWRETEKASRSGQSPPEIVFFGDSLFKGGIAPGVVEQTTGRRAFNLSVSGGQPSSSYFLLRRVLRRDPRPVAVVVAHLPSLLELGPRSNQHRWPALLGVGEGVELARTARDSDLFAAGLLARLVPTYRLRPVVRGNLLAALRGEDRRDRQVVPPYLVRNQRINKGSAILGAPSAAPTVDLSTEGDGPSPWTCHPVNAVYLRRFFALAASRGVPVFWVLPPRHPALHTRDEHSGFDARWSRFVREAAAPFANVTVVDGRRSEYAPEVFADAIHLVHAGAAVLSADLGAILRRTLDGTSTPRWIDLPAYRPLATIAVEDLDESRSILRARRTRRR